MREIFSGGTENFYTRGDKIAVGEDIHYITSGVVAFYSSNGKKRHFLFYLRPGEIFPLTPASGKYLLSGKASEFKAMSNVSTVSIPREEFEKRAYSPDNIKDLVGSLMEIMQLQIERIDNLQHDLVLSRLVERLRFVAQRLGATHGNKIVIDTPVSHADLALSIGSSRETVNRMMKKLEKQGLISVRNQTIIINSLDKLTALAVQPPGRFKLARSMPPVALAAFLVADAAFNMIDSVF